MTISLDGLFGGAGGNRPVAATGTGQVRAEFRALLDGLLAPGDDAGLLPVHRMPDDDWQGGEDVGPELSWPGLVALLGRGVGRPDAETASLAARLEQILVDPEADGRAAALLARLEPEELEAALILADADLPAEQDGASDAAEGRDATSDLVASEHAVDGLAAEAAEARVSVGAVGTGSPDGQGRGTALPDGGPGTAAARVAAARTADSPGPASDRPAPDPSGLRPGTADGETARLTPANGTTGEASASTEVAGAPARTTSGQVHNRPVGLPAAVERVLDAVAELEHLPPPRQLTLDLGEARIRVTLDDGQVRLTLLDASRGGQDLLDEASEALAQQGFDLARDGDGRRGGRDGAATSDAPTSETTSARARRLRAGGGLRL